MFHPLYNHLRHKWELQNQNDRPYFPEYPDKHHGLSVHAVYLNPEKPDVPLNKNDAFQKVQKRRVQEKR